MVDTLTTREDAQQLLRVEKLSKSYVAPGRWLRRARANAASDIDLEIQAGRTLALVGSSGSGKSTVARCITRLERPDTGHIWLNGVDIARLRRRDLAAIRPNIQIIFQDAITSINPRFLAAEAIAEPLRIQGKDRSHISSITESVMREVGLSPDWLARSVMDFSGGQRQRLAIARALTTRPKLLVLDEAFTGLDLSIQAQIANLLLDLQAAHALSYLLISHDLMLVGGMADTIAVMSHGRIVEQGTTPQVLADPEHDETKKLVTSANAAASQFFRRTGASA